MPRLEDLRTDIKDMSHDQLLGKIRDIREDRKISKKAITVRKARADKKLESLKKQLRSLSLDERELFLASLGAAKDEDGGSQC